MDLSLSSMVDLESITIKSKPVVEVDVTRHGGEHIPAEPLPKPTLGRTYELNDAVLDALPIPGTKVISVRKYSVSLWGVTAKIFAKLPDGNNTSYFLKSVSLGVLGYVMIKGEYESLKAISKVAPEFATLPHRWGKYRQCTEDTYFLLAQFCHIGEQPPDSIKFTSCLADMHRRSVSPTGKFGFHTTTCHAMLPQITDCWEDSWEVLYTKQLAQMIKLDAKKHGEWSEFQHVCELTLEKVIPQLLGQLQTGGRSIKPCLVHSNLWDRNTAADIDTDEPFVFDAASFYAHNEYEIGNWRAKRHHLSVLDYVKGYKKIFLLQNHVSTTPLIRPNDEIGKTYN